MPSRSRTARAPVGSTGEIENAAVEKYDPTEIAIYVKALRRALKYVPIGSRAYYYLEGEIVRANKSLKASAPADPTFKGPH